MKKFFAFLVIIAITMSVPACATTPPTETETTEVMTYETEEIILSDIDYLALVNQTHALPEGWENGLILDTATNGFGEQIQIEHRTYEQFLKLQEDLAEIGIEIELDSVYRSVDAQQALWDEWVITYGEEYVHNYLAVPGYSEHHTGLAVDIFIVKNGERIYDNDAMIAETEIFEQIHAHMAMFGFILRYPEGREDITGYSYEPWHLRFINDEELAQYIMDQGLTLEEYLNEA